MRVFKLGVISLLLLLPFVSQASTAGNKEITVATEASASPTAPAPTSPEAPASPTAPAPASPTAPASGVE